MKTVKPALQSQLEAEFPPEQTYSRPGEKGVTLTCLRVADVIQRLTEVFGDWSFLIQKANFGHREVIVHGRLIAGNQVKDNFGCCKLADLESSDDYGLAVKIATSDAIKKCATLLSVGLYLYNQAPNLRSEPMTLAQFNALRVISQKRSIPWESIQAKSKKLFGTYPGDLSRKECSRLIQAL